MRFTFLGTGTSSGVPAIACSCAVCSSTDPRDARLRCSAAIEFLDPSSGPRTILIDASPDLRIQALRAKLTRCDAILFTHNHVDHTFGLDEVRRFNAVQKSPIPVFADHHTAQHLTRVYSHIFDRANNVNDSFVATLTLHPLTPFLPVTLHGVRITPLRLLHGNLPILGFRIDSTHSSPSRRFASAGHADDSPFPLAYCTDVSAIPPETYPHLTGLRTLVLDALRHRRHPTHLTLQQAVDIADRVGAHQTYFTHMAHDLPHDETNRSLPPAMSLAHDGLMLGSLSPTTA